MAKKKQERNFRPLGLDLVDMTPDYTKSFEENKAIWAKRYKAVHGEWPPWMPEGPKPKQDEPGSTDSGAGGK